LKPLVALNVSQQVLGGIVGASRENVNGQLRVWQRAGLLELGKRRVVIRDLEALEELI
jgi:CRP/FNR family transcriptional regulator, cyclic AMP receptor protein